MARLRLPETSTALKIGRRFGSVTVQAGPDLDVHSILASLGADWSGMTVDVEPHSSGARLVVWLETDAPQAIAYAEARGWVIDHTSP